MRTLIACFFLSLFLLIPDTLSASKKAFNPCFQKNSQSIYPLAGIDCLAVSESNLVCHDPEEKLGDLPPGFKILTFDPFTRIYEIRTPDKLNPVVFKGLSKIATGRELALIDKKDYRLGHVISYANGIDGFGHFSHKDTLGKVIGAKCYTVVGIGSIDGRYIPSEFVQKFIEKKNSIYGDIGIRLEKKGNAFVVVKRDLFFPDNPFEKGDEIISINGREYKRFDALTFAILFAKPGTEFSVKLKRNGRNMNVKVCSGIRYGGGYLTDTFLERFGLYFDENLVIKMVREDSYADKAGMKPGDRLLQFDGTPVETIDALTTLLTDKKEQYSSTLFDRDGFQFFFTIH